MANSSQPMTHYLKHFSLTYVSINLPFLQWGIDFVYVECTFDIGNHYLKNSERCLFGRIQNKTLNPDTRNNGVIHILACRIICLEKKIYMLALTVRNKFKMAEWPLLLCIIKQLVVQWYLVFSGCLGSRWQKGSRPLGPREYKYLCLSSFNMCQGGVNGVGTEQNCHLCQNNSILDPHLPPSSSDILCVSHDLFHPIRQWGVVLMLQCGLI